MRTVQKNVYYCDHCKKHGLSRHAMEGHESRCTMNPTRTCGWGEPHSFDFRSLAEALRSRAPLAQGDVDWLHDEVEGCPACMLAALRQSAVEYHHNANYVKLWDYDEEVERYREAEREEAQEQVRHDIESTWL